MSHISGNPCQQGHSLSKYTSLSNMGHREHRRAWPETSGCFQEILSYGLWTQFYFKTVSCSSDCPRTHYVAEDNNYLLTLISPCLKWWITDVHHCVQLPSFMYLIVMALLTLFPLFTDPNVPAIS